MLAGAVGGRRSAARGLGLLRTDGGFADIPPSWRNAVRFLDEQPGPTGAMVLPGAGFAVQTWGGRSTSRSKCWIRRRGWPGPGDRRPGRHPSTARLDRGSVGEARLSSAWPEAWERLGITHVVVRNDLDPAESDAPTPDLVAATMDRIPGARVVATFGEEAGGEPTIVVHELRHEGDPRVSVQDWDRRVVVAGGPEVVPDVLAAALCSRSRPSCWQGPDRTPTS